MTNLSLALPRTLGIISGRGGSGKTLVSAALAMAAARLLGTPVVLVDCDTGTGGLSFYLGLNYGINTSDGLADFLRGEEGSVRLQGIRGMPGISMVPVGDIRNFLTEGAQIKLKMEDVISSILAQQLSSLVIFDCRGGIDSGTLNVCKAVDELLIVAETDVAAIQTTRNLVDILSRRKLISKVRGFILNKAFDDPAPLAKAGHSLFGVSYLGALPFDFEAVRAFTRGEFPGEKTMFAYQIDFIFRSKFLEEKNVTGIPQDHFSSLSLSDKYTRNARVFVVFFGSAAMYVASMAAFLLYSETNNHGVALYAVSLLILSCLTMFMMLIISSSETYNRTFGRLVEGYVNTFSAVLGRFFSR